MKVCKQAEHCAYMVRLIADRCEGRMAKAHEKAEYTKERNAKNPDMWPCETEPEKIADFMTAGCEFTRCEGMSNEQLHEQIVAARRELLALDKAIQAGEW